MKKKLAAGMLALCLSAGAAAQEKFTDHLKRRTAGQGTVVVHQDATIEDLVNGVSTPSKATPAKPAPDKTDGQGGQKAGTDTASAAEAENAGAKTSKVKGKANGYRIQVYSGGNSRDARQEAMRMGNQVKSYFADLPVYTHFYSPRWICRVGDFKTYEEANDMLRQLQETKKFNEAVIVKSKIVVEY